MKAMTVSLTPAPLPDAGEGRFASRWRDFHIKGIVSPVAGKADILVVPDLEAGNMLAKQLTFMANAEAAGIVVGARVPIILTSRADGVTTRLASCAVAALLGDAVRKGMAGLKDGD